MDGWKSKKGSLTVEASIIIVLFLFGYLSIVSVTNFIRAQMIIQYSISQAAKDISSYCYIISKTGLMEDSTRLEGEANAAKADADKVIDTVVKLYQAVESGSGTIKQEVDEITMKESWLEKIEAIENAGDVTSEEFNQMVDAANTMIQEGGAYFSNPDAILKGLLSVAKDEAFSQAKTYVLAAPISKAMVSGQVEAYGVYGDGKDILEHLGVVGGIQGLNFTGSTLFNDGSTIEVKVAYTMKVEFPFFENKEFHFIQTASTKAWGSGNNSRPWRK